MSFLNVSSSSLVFHICTPVLIARRCVNPKKYAYCSRPKKVRDRSLDPPPPPKKFRGCKFLIPLHVYCDPSPPPRPPRALQTLSL